MALPTIQVQEYSVQNAMILLSNTIRNWIDDNVVYIRQPRAENTTLNDIVDPGIFFIGAGQYGLEASYSSGALLFVINNGHINVEDDGEGNLITETIENVKDIQMLLNLDNFSIKMRTKNSNTEETFENVWVAAGGSSDAAAILTADLLITEPIGRITQEILNENNGFYTIEKLNGDNTPKTIEQVLNDLLSVTKQPIIIEPSISINASDIHGYEVGTKVMINYSIETDPGNYQFGPETGVTFSEYKATLNGTTKEAKRDTFSITVTDGMNISLTAQAKYSDGNIPKDNKGNDAALGQITSGTVTATSSKKLAGYWNAFYGTLNDKNIEINSSVIRSLNMTNKNAADRMSFDIIIPVGAQEVIIAYPANLRELTSVLDVNDSNANIVSSFKNNKFTMNVNGASADYEKEYQIYFYKYANPNDVINTYKVTI